MCVVEYRKWQVIRSLSSSHSALSDFVSVIWSVQKRFHRLVTKGKCLCVAMILCIMRWQCSHVQPFRLEGSVALCLPNCSRIRHALSWTAHKGGQQCKYVFCISNCKFPWEFATYTCSCPCNVIVYTVIWTQFCFFLTLCCFSIKPTVRVNVCSWVVCGAGILDLWFSHCDINRNTCHFIGYVSLWGLWRK